MAAHRHHPVRGAADSREEPPRRPQDRQGHNRQARQPRRGGRSGAQREHSRSLQSGDQRHRQRGRQRRQRRARPCAQRRCFHAGARARDGAGRAGLAAAAKAQERRRRTGRQVRLDNRAARVHQRRDSQERQQDGARHHSRRAGCLRSGELQDAAGARRALPARARGQGFEVARWLSAWRSAADGAQAQSVRAATQHREPGLADGLVGREEAARADPRSARRARGIEPPAAQAVAASGEPEQR